MCYVVGDYDAAIREAKDSNVVDKNYELPDGSKILIGTERFKCAEALFKPEAIGVDCTSVH
jgi:actin-related protein